MVKKSPLDGLEELIIPEDEAFEPYVRTLSVVIFQTKWKVPITDTKKALETIMLFLENKWGFKKERGRSVREGFFDFQQNTDSLSFLFGRESSLKIDWVNEKGEPELRTDRIRNLDSQHRVYANLVVKSKSAEITLFGGSDNLLLRVAGLANVAIRSIALGGHETAAHALSKEAMLELLAKFNNEVDYIFVDPGQSEMLRKTVKEKELNEEVVRFAYDVYTTYHGYKITNSPAVQQTLRDAGVYIKEIQGRIFYEHTKITVRINAIGKVVFSIPTSMAREEEDARKIAFSLYKDIIDKGYVGFSQMTIDGYGS